MRLVAALLFGLLLAPLHARAQTCRITVTVDGDDGPVAAALVRLFDRRGTEVATGTTDGEGRYTVGVRSAWYRVYVSAPGHLGHGVHGYSTADIESIEGDVAIRLRLSPLVPLDRDGGVPMARPPDGEIRGRVRTPEGLAIEGAVVEATGYAGGSTAGPTLTASDGSYRLRVSPGTYSIRASKGSVAPPPSSPRVVPREWEYYPAAFLEPHISVNAGRVARAQDLVLVHTRAVRVMVTVRDDSGAVVPSASLSYVSRRGANTVAGEHDTEADGTVAVGPFSPGEVTLHARAREGTPEALAGVLRLSVGEEPHDDVTMVLSAGARLRGHVQFDGRSDPLHNPTGLRVLDGAAGRGFGWRSDRPRGDVDQHGRFELDALVDGQCLTLVGIPAGWHLAAIDLSGENYLKRPLRLAPGEIVTGLVMRVVPGDSMDGDHFACTPGRSDPP